MITKIQTGLLVFLLFIGIGGIKAQTTFVLAPDSCDIQTGATGAAVLCYSYVYNLTNDTINLIWKRIKNQLQSGWNTSICDEWVCHDSTTNTYPFYIFPNDSMPLVGHFWHHNIIGTGTIDLLVYDPLDSLNENSYNTYHAMVSSVSIEELDQNTPLMVPYYNYNTNSIDVTFNIPSFQQSELILIEPLGRVVETIQIDQPSGKVSVQSNFSSGMYFLMLRNKERNLEVRKVVVIK